MERLSIKILEKMFREKLTRCETGFLLCASRYQDKKGHVKGLYYKEISGEMNCSFPMFYAAMRSLEEKGFISCEKKDATDYDITILGNDYETSDLYKDDTENFRNNPYINTRHDIFYSKEFYKLKPGAQLMAMDFMGVTRINKGQYKIKVENFFSKYQKLLRVKKRTLKAYLTQLQEFFSIGSKDGMYWIRAKAKVYRNSGNTEIEDYNEQQIRMTCRRNKIQTGSQEEIQDVSRLIKQYGRKCIGVGRDALQTVLDAIRRSVEPAWGMADEGKALNPRLVHKWVKTIIETERVDVLEKGDSQESRLTVGKENSFNNFHQRDYDMEALEKMLCNI